MRDTLARGLRAWILCVGLVVAVPAATIQIQSIEGFVHYGGGAAPQDALSIGSPGFSSQLDGDNLGSFLFLWQNTTGAEITGLTFTVFFDADIDNDANTFFNEYGEFVSLALPVLAPAGAIAPTDWEIDEPEYVYGNIYTHSWEGALDNSNGVPSSAPDDVSHALLFQIPKLSDGQLLSIYGTLSLTDAAGLAQVDPDSNVTLYFNGYAVLGEEDDPPPPPPPPTGEVPEPGTISMLALGTAGLAALRLRGGKS
jgi:hypothetical protein